MTSETRVFVELTDIAGLEFSCRKCGTKILYPLEKQYDRLADKCPNCFEPWLSERPNKQPGEPPIADLILRTLASLRGISETSGVKAHVRLHVKC